MTLQEIPAGNAAAGTLTLDGVRSARNVGRFEVLVDLGAVVLGGGPTWCRLRKLRKPGARFPVEVWLEGWLGGVGHSSAFRDAEVLAVRRGAPSNSKRGA